MVGRCRGKSDERVRKSNKRFKKYASESATQKVKYKFETTVRGVEMKDKKRGKIRQGWQGV